ncbi:MAG: glycoside hydrolase family 26 protein [Desulfobacca sp.]|uniref:glycoside hydrolase family 26 protein n=1 Tax=Desulfobacca sp. TaxID=2067990 RepID=UPI00404B3BF9
MRRRLALGLYDPGCPPRLGPVATWQEELGVPITIISWYQAWGSGQAAPRPDLIQEAQRLGLIPLITWEPWRLPETAAERREPACQPDFALGRLLSGSYDHYLDTWAAALAQCQGPLWLRPMHEMNGNWYPWGGTVNGNTPGLYQEAWRYLRQRFAAAGAHQISWVWCPYVHSVPDTPDNALEGYFPGPDQVDWLALDGYNWGTSQTWSRWQSFAELFGEAYQRLLALAPEKPVMIAELGCAEAGGEKAMWLRQAFGEIISHFDKIQAVVWFHVNKECNWRLDSTPAVLQALRQCRPLFCP